MTLPARNLRIAQVAPLFESVPPQLYGGTERIVSYLTDELLALGHTVTLFASGDSVSRARVIAPCAQALRLAGVKDPLPFHFTMLEDVYRRADEFDVVHLHVDYMHFPATRRQNLVHLSTIHNRPDLPEVAPMYREFCELPLVSISLAQRGDLTPVNWIANVPHGLPLALHAPGPGGEALAFVGRLSRDKRPDRAIAIAERAGLPLRIAAKFDDSDPDFTVELQPMLAKSHVEFLGELREAEKGELLRTSRALVFPIAWPEPFGLVMIEAMACGTPVIAFRCGSVAEVIDQGVTGFIVDSIDEAVLAVERAGQLSRAAVRERFESRFAASRMARDYVALYHELINQDARDRSRDPGLLHPGNQLARG